MNVIEKHIRYFKYFDKILLFFTAFYCLRVWLFPSFEDIDLIHQISSFVYIELIVVFGVVFTFNQQKIGAFLLLLFFIYEVYSELTSNGVLTALLIYGLIILNRIYFIFLKIPEETHLKEAVLAMNRVKLYLILMGLWTTLGHLFVPEVGLNKAFLKEAGYFTKEAIVKSQTESPHIAITLNVVYFLVLGFSSFSFAKKRQEQEIKALNPNPNYTKLNGNIILKLLKDLKKQEVEDTNKD